MKRVSVWSAVSTLVCALALFVDAPARAETDILWPRFSVSAGAYDLSTSDDIRIDGAVGPNGTPIDLELDLGLPDSDTLLAFAFDWSFAKRHTIGARYYSFDRDGSRSIFRQIEIGDTTFPVGAELSASFETTTIEAVYTYWFVRKDNLGFGGSFGLVDLGVDLRARASVQVGSGGGSAERRVDASTDLPVPMIGVAVKGRPWKRLVLNAGLRILPSVSIGDIDGEAASYNLSAEVFVFGPLAVGLSYDGTYYKVDVDDSDWNGSLDLKSDGLRLYLRAAF